MPIKHWTQFFVCILALGLVMARGDDWVGWRGPSGLGVSSEQKLPSQWSKDQNIRWKASIPGKGASSPVVVGDRVYLTSQTPDTALHVLSIDRKDGKTIWDREIGQGKERAHQFHNMATPTPASDGKFVWARFGTGHVVGLDAAGKVIWERNLGKELGAYSANHGMGTSPMLFGNTLFIACMHQGPSYLIALEPMTGKTLWKKERNLAPKDEGQDSYSSPLFISVGGSPQLVVAGAEAVNAYDPATGAELWIHDGMKVPHPYGRTISGPAAGEGVVIGVASGFQNRGYAFAIPASGHGHVSEDQRLWTCTKFSPDCATPVVYQGKVYFIRDDGMASCLDLKTGEAHWQERLFTANVKISPVAGDGKVYFLNGEGNCTVVKAAPKLEVIATNELKETTLSTPAISQGGIFIRTETQLYRIGS